MKAAQILMNDFVRQWADTSEDVLAATREVGESGWYILGKQVAGAECALAKALGHAHAVGCANGLDAIEIGLRALGLVAGQKVLTTPLSAYATTLAITRAGGTPVFVDVDASGLVDLELAERAFEQDRSLRFFVPVHLYGHALDLEALDRLKSRFDLKIVEDCCQAIGAKWADRSVGSVGQLSAVSFYPTKNLGVLGDGGAVFTDDEALDGVCRQLRDYGQTSKYVHDLAGLNSRLDELHAAILARAYLPRLARWTERRAEIASRYLAGIDHPGVKPLLRPMRSHSVWHLFPVSVAPAKRDEFIAHLRQCGVHSAIHYPKLISDQRALEGVPFERASTLERARAIAESEVSLPIHPYLSDQEVERVVAAVNGWATT